MPFSYVCISVVVHFTAFVVLEHVMNAVSICIAETQILSCVLLTFCMSQNLHLSQKWYELFTTCIMYVYSVCKTHTSETSNQPQSVHSLGMLIGENLTVPQLLDFRLRTRCKCGLLYFGIVLGVDW